jgi:DNA primase
MIDFATIRASNPIADFCQSRGMELRRNGPEGQFVCLCPLHAEKTPSFTIYPDGHYFCFGCGGRGDVIDLMAKLEDMDITEAAKKLASDYVCDSQPLIPPKVVTPKEPYILTKADMKRMASAAHRLAGDLTLIKTFAASRPEWTEEAIRGAALDGDLGYEENCEHKELSGPAILFGYAHGLKARWLTADRNGKRIFRWLCGGAQGECWRQSLLGNWHQAVYITEGETDALTLLSCEVEDEDSLVVALAGAEMMPNPRPFTGRDITIIPDPDKAGEMSVAKLTALLEPVATSIKTFSLKR